MLRDHNEIIRNRYAKADAMRAKGLNPYVNVWHPTHSSSSIRANADTLIAEKTPVRVAGRIMTVRHMGKASFFHLQDGDGRIQVYIKRDVTAAADYEVFKTFADMGDIAGVTGEVFVTKTGELTVLASTFEILTKSVRPLPEKWHGLTDVETRFRQRYVDLIVNPQVREKFVIRSRMISAIRSMLESRGYLEVETPMMHPVCGGAAARPFVTHHNALNMDLYLRIAPELYLKRLTVGGLEKTFEINRNFRNEGLSARHNPEFTMLELYTAYWDYRDTMELTEDLIRQTTREVLGRTELVFGRHKIDVGPPFERMTYLEALEKYYPASAGVGFSWSDPLETTRAKAAALGYKTDAATTHGIISELFEHHVEPHLDGPVFITEFPKAASPLAKSKPEDPAVAERFELYMCGMEIANGYSELNDPREQYERFLEQMTARSEGDDEAHEMDEDYVRALECGMAPTSGLGVGMDRLAMLLTDSPSIREVILFPLMKPE
jgi:lysyl-tRNA synthetase class 2